MRVSLGVKVLDSPAQYGSHVNIRFLEYAIACCILIIIYPPYSTYRLQPLDIALFALLASYYVTALDQWMQKTEGLYRIIKREFYGLFRSVFISAMSKKNIESGWKRTGLLLFDSNVVLSQIKVLESYRSSTDNSQSVMGCTY